MASRSAKRALSEIDVNVSSPSKKTKPNSKSSQTKTVSRPSDYNKLTVKELQQELRRRSIYKTGTKSQLVMNLQQDDLADQREELQEKNKSVVAEANYEELKVPGLKAELEARELKVGGSKAELVERLHQNDRDQVHKKEQERLFKEEIKRDESEKVVDYAKEAAAVLKGSLPDYEKMSMPEISQRLSEKGLMDKKLKQKGDVSEMRQRLRQADIEITVEYKQIMEKDAKERRERFAELKKKAGINESHDDEFRRHWKKYEEVTKRGPKAKPLYDDSGYPLSYEKLSNQPTRYNRSLAASERRMDHYERKAQETKEKAAIMGVPYERGDTSSNIDWIVAKDLEIPWHTVEMSDYKEWKRRGFKASVERLKRVKEEDGEVMMQMMPGSAFRVGYVRS
ncbi:SAP [Glarea lozoyensis ATCC 20868]|uniref:SAP n=2 Tax=Glarea lozoyensis TaxID=101852 RepID=S3CU49_GLAL2|nr:SAP [Glarea lozoyensis ATCC 20868]EHK98480.1 hypothetical protein M7I_5725 [Glarea lozoyensis 74030]EPE28554.1 SAP [Glarea lozoyensis ATCC 20868]